MNQNRRRHDPPESEAHAHRRATDDDAVLRLHSRVEDCEKNIRLLLESQRQMTENLKRLTDNTGRLADVLEAWNNVRGFWWTLKMMSGAAKIMIPIAVVVGGVWVFIKTGKWAVGG